MQSPSSANLSHDFEAYKGLSLRELFHLVLYTTISFALVFIMFGIAAGWVVAFGCIGFLLGFIFALTIMPKPISRLKAGKPYGYLKKKLLVTLVKIGIVKCPYLHHKGILGKTLRVRGPHV